MTSPLIDTTFGTTGSHGGSGGPFTINSLNKTGGTNRVMVLVVSYNWDSTGSGEITGVTDTAFSTLTWTRALKVVDTTSGAHNTTIEVWTAPASAIFNPSAGASTQTFTFSTTSNLDQWAALIFAVQGVNDITSPFDSHTGLPASAFNASSTTPPTVTFSTAQADDLLIGFSARANSFGCVTPSGWTSVGGSGGSGGLNGATVQVDDKSVSATQSGATYTNAAAGSDNSWTSAVVAFTADVSSSGPSGTMAPTEAADSFAAAGYLPITGTMAPTEAADLFVTPRESSGVMAVTEAKDSFAFSGHPIGELFIDASASGEAHDPGGSPPSSAEVTLSTNNPDDIIVLAITTGGNSHKNPVSSVTDTAGLTWKRRAQRQYAPDARPWQELWWAHAPTVLSADVITVNTAGPNGVIAISAVAIGNANVTAPWDTNVLANQWSNNHPFGSPTTGRISTSATNTMILAFYANNNSTVPTPSAPLAALESVSGSEHNGFDYISALATALVTTKQDATLLGYGSGGAIMSDAIVQVGLTGTADGVLWYLDGVSYQVGGAPFWPTNTVSLTAANGSVSTNITTNDPDEVILAVIGIKSAGGLGQVASMSDSIGLSPGWTRRSRTTNTNGTMALEVWWAWTNRALTNSDGIAVNTTNTASGDTVSILLFGVGGTRGFFDGIWWDGDAALPDYNHSDVPPPPPGGSPAGVPINAPGFSTINQNTLNLMFAMNIDSTAAFKIAPNSDAVSPYAMGPLLQSVGPVMNLGVLFGFSDSPLTGQTISDTLAPLDWVVIADAIPVGPPLPPTGVWGSTEGVDIFAAAGFVPILGTISAVESADKQTGAPAQAPYGGIGWLGWVPAFATWASVDGKDAAFAEGWVIGVPITGRLKVTESADRMAAGNRTSVTGTFLVTELHDGLASGGFEIPLIPPPLPKKRKVMIVN